MIVSAANGVRELVHSLDENLSLDELEFLEDQSAKLPVSAAARRNPLLDDGHISKA